MRRDSHRLAFVMRRMLPVSPDGQVMISDIAYTSFRKGSQEGKARGAPGRDRVKTALRHLG
jgi:hypothetical protein